MIHVVFKYALYYRYFVEHSENAGHCLKSNELFPDEGPFVGNFSDNNVQWRGNSEKAGRKLGCISMDI